MSDVTQAALPAETSPDRVAIASQWQLIWWAFRRHRLAMVGLWVIGILYLMAMFAEFVAPDDPFKQNRRAVFHPPQMIHFIDRTEDGIRLRPYVWEMDRQRDPDTLAISYLQMLVALTEYDQYVSLVDPGSYNLTKGHNSSADRCFFGHLFLWLIERSKIDPER